MALCEKNSYVIAPELLLPVVHALISDKRRTAIAIKCMAIKCSLLHKNKQK